MMFPRAHFHDGLSCRHRGRRDLFTEYGSWQAVDLVSNFRGSGDPGLKDLSLISQQSRADLHGHNCLSASVPCLPLLPPVSGEGEKSRCIESAKDIRRRYVRVINTSRSNKRICEQHKLQASVLRNHFQMGNVSFPKELVRVWMTKLAKEVGDDLQKEPYIPPIDSTLAGGCIRSFTLPVSLSSQSDKTRYLCHTGGEEQEEVVVTAILDSSENQTSQKTKTCSVTPVASRIKQICCGKAADKVFLGVRCDAETRVFCGQPRDDGNFEISKIHHKKWGKTRPTCIATSEFIPGEALVTGDNGRCFLIDHSGRSVTAVKAHKKSFHSPEPWHHAQFGSHPRQILLAEATSCTIYDIRGKCSNTKIFQLPHNLLNPLERITAASIYRTDPNYCLLATQTSLVLSDMRFPNCAVLHWNHNMPAAPAYMSLVDGVTSDLSHGSPLPFLHGSSQDVVLLGSQEDSEIQVFPLSLSQPPPVKTGLPWALSRPSDILGFELASELVEPLLIEKRLNSSYCGVTGLPNTGGGFTAYSITEMGDVFYQTFSPTSAKREKTWRYGPGSHLLKVPDWAKDVCERWTNECQQKKDEEVLVAVENEAQADLKEKAVLKQRGKKTLYLDSSEKYPRKELAHVLCWLCMRQLQDEDGGSSSQSDQRCCACDMLIRDGHYISETVLKDDVMQKLVQPASTLEKQLGQKNLEIPDDPYSQILKKLWDEDEPDLTELVQQREDVIKKAVEETKRLREMGKYGDDDEEDIDGEIQEAEVEDILRNVGQGDSVAASSMLPNLMHSVSQTPKTPVGSQETVQVVQEKTVAASQKTFVNDDDIITSTPVGSSQNTSQNTFESPHGHISSPRAGHSETETTPFTLSQLPAVPRRQRRLSGSSNVSACSVNSTASQGFLTTPKRLLSRSRQSSPCPSGSPVARRSIISPLSTPVHDSFPMSQSFLSGLSMSQPTMGQHGASQHDTGQFSSSQPSSQRPSTKRKAPQGSSVKKKHRMGF